MTAPSRIGAAVPYLHMIEQVKLEESDWPDAGSVNVSILWKGVDRPEWGGVSLNAADRALAERLRDVILRGDAFEHVDIRTDVNGRTYMSVHNRFSAVELRQDLDTLDRIGPHAGASLGQA